MSGMQSAQSLLLSVIDLFVFSHQGGMPRGMSESPFKYQVSHALINPIGHGHYFVSAIRFDIVQV